jgi:transcriptional regulator with XRE-family HTH domain
MVEHGLGSRLRASREAAGWSLARMAAATHFTRGHLSNVERGLRRATPDVVLGYERALQEDDVRRRTLITGLASAAIAPMVMSEAIHGAFTAGLSRPLSVDEWVARADAYGRDYMSLGADDLSARLIGDLVRLQQYVTDTRVFAPAARLMTVYGKTLPANADALGAGGAVRWYRLATVMADRSGDLPTRIWVRGRAALALAYEGAERPMARALSDEALALSDSPSLGRLNALVARAHVAGSIGDREAAESLMADAERVFEVVGSSEQVSDFAVPEWRFHTFASMLWSRLGDERLAVIEQDAADATRPASLPRFATHIRLHRGLMLAKAGDRLEGRAAADVALAELPPERHSLSLRLMRAEIERA